jgi:NTE family protein
MVGLRKEKRSKMKVGLALGGGAAKGIAHIGVLKVLREVALPVDLVVGTSMGALIGALYCQNKDLGQVEKAILDALASENLSKFGVEVENLTMSSRNKKEHSLQETFRRLHLYYHAFKDYGVVEDKKIILAISELLPESSVEVLSPGFAAVASDLYSGLPVILNKGSLREAVRASISVPLIFPPVQSSGRLLVDGMVTSLVPVEEAFQLGADVVVAVDVQGPLTKKETPQNAVEVMVRCESISSYQLKEKCLEKAEVVIKPFSSGGKSWDFKNGLDYIQMGEEAARQQLAGLRQIVLRAGEKSLLKRLEELLGEEKVGK